MGLSAHGLVLARGVNRLPLDQRWVTEGWTELKGFPSDVRPRVRSAAALPLEDKEPLQKREDPKALHEYHGPSEGKAFFVRKADVADNRFGKTPGCPGCDAVKNKVTYPVAHSDTCRQRVYQKLFEEDDARVHKFVERMSQAMESEEERLQREEARGRQSRDKAVKRRMGERPRAQAMMQTLPLEMVRRRSLKNYPFKNPKQ